MVDDLREALAEARPGDALLVRTGRWQAARGRSVEEQHELLSGLHHDCMLAIQEADIGVLGTDGAAENFPSTHPNCSRPIHIFTLTYLEMPLLHNLDLDALAEKCAHEGRRRFMFTIAPLNMPGTTGSPVTPVAVM